MTEPTSTSAPQAGGDETPVAWTKRSELEKLRSMLPGYARAIWAARTDFIEGGEPADVPLFTRPTPAAAAGVPTEHTHSEYADGFDDGIAQAQRAIHDKRISIYRADDEVRLVYESREDAATAMNRIINDRASPVAPAGVPTTDAVRDVLAERERQKSVEGWTAAHDDGEHEGGALARAAACYALHAGDCGSWSESAYQSAPPPNSDPDGDVIAWPWGPEWWKPKNPRRDLVRAAALTLAEIERLDRAVLSAGAPAVPLKDEQDSVHQAADDSSRALRAASQETPRPELDPCPFCGCAQCAVIPDADGDGPMYYGYCPACNTEGPVVDSTATKTATEAEAIAAWNRRPRSKANDSR